MEPKILAETEDQTRRLVELEAWHEADWDGATSTVITASLTQSGTEIRRMNNAKSPKKFWLDASTADAFCEAWTKFKADQEANKKTEEERKQKLVEEAHTVARKHPEIRIRECKGYWDVSIPSQAYFFACPAYSPDHLMEQVKTCQAVLVGREDTTIGGDAA